MLGSGTNGKWICCLRLLPRTLLDQANTRITKRIRQLTPQSPHSAPCTIAPAPSNSHTTLLDNASVMPAIRIGTA